MTMTMGQTVYDIFGPNIGHLGCDQIAALGAYALTDEYMKNLSGSGIGRRMVVCILKTTKGLKKRGLRDMQINTVKMKREKFRLIDERMNARS